VCGYDWRNRFFAVVAGASADDLEAVTQLLRALPNNTGMPFVFIQAPELAFTTLRADLLAQLLWL
jgi:chemotaxis response regulator CheB